jgi:hypothetical protein
MKKQNRAFGLSPRMAQVAMKAIRCRRECNSCDVRKNCEKLYLSLGEWAERNPPFPLSKKQKVRI